MTEYGSAFTRTSAGGKLVGVVKYKDADGRWRQRSRTLGGSGAAAQAEFREWLASIGAARPGREGVGDLVLETLSGELARGLIERSTYEAQLGYALNHIVPAFEGEPVGCLTPARVERWAEGMSARLSPSSARVAWNVLRKACARACRDGLIESSPFDRARPPRAASPRPAHLGRAERARLVAAVRGDWGADSPYGAAALIALYAGLRCGEVCALRWRDVAGGEVRVRSAVGRSRGGGYLKAPKSAASARSFPATEQLASVLEARRARAAGPGGDVDGSWFVCGDRGSFPEPKALSRAFARLCERHGVRDSLGRRATFHTLRHTFATMAVGCGVDVKTLSSILGHAGADVTLNVYASPDEGAKRAGMARMSEVFSAEGPGPDGPDPGPGPHGRIQDS